MSWAGEHPLEASLVRARCEQAPQPTLVGSQVGQRVRDVRRCTRSGPGTAGDDLVADLQGQVTLCSGMSSRSVHRPPVAAEDGARIDSSSFRSQNGQSSYSSGSLMLGPPTCRPRGVARPRGSSHSSCRPKTVRSSHG